MRSDQISRRSALLFGAALVAAPHARAQGTGAPLKLGLIGAGRLGSVLGTLWVKAGHPVLFSSRHPETLSELVSGLGPLARAGTPAEAIAFGDVVVVAVPYGALPQIGRDYGKELAGKIVLDACNAVAAQRTGRRPRSPRRRASAWRRPPTCPARAWSAASTRWARGSWRPRTTGPTRSPSRWLATTGRRWRSSPGWCATQGSCR